MISYPVLIADLVSHLTMHLTMHLTTNDDTTAAM